MTVHSSLMRCTGIDDGPRSAKHRRFAFMIAIFTAGMFLLASAPFAAEGGSGNPAAQGQPGQEKVLPALPDKPAPPPNPAAIEQEAADQAFLNQTRKMTEDFRAEKDRLSRQISQLEEQNRALAKTVQGQGIQDTPLRFLLGMAFMADWGVMIVLWFFPLMILNHFLYLVIREKRFFKAHRILIVVSFIVIEVFFFLPLIANAELTPTATAGEPKPAPTVQAPEDSFEEMLRDIGALLKMSDVEKAIYILTHTQEGYVSIRKLNIKDPVLNPWKGSSIRIGSAEHHFVLAYLYRHLQKDGLALTQLEQMVDIRLTPREKEDQGREYIDMYDSVLRFFIDRSQFVEARKAGETLVELYVAQGDFQRLKDLCQFFVANGMDESAAKGAGALISAYESKKDAESLLGFFEFLTNSKMQELAKNVGEILIDLYTRNRDLEHLITVSELLRKNYMPEPALQALKRASEISTSIREKVLLARHLIEKGDGVNAKIFIDQTVEELQRAKGERGTDDAVYMARFLVEIGEKPKAASLLDAMIMRTTSLDQIIKVAMAACEFEFLSIAIHAIEWAVNNNYGGVRDYHLAPPQLLPASKFLPTDQDIHLAAYLGIVQQKSGKPEDAQYSYKAALRNDLEAIVRSSGYEISGNINEFFYLKQLWQEAYPQKLEFVLPLYSYLQAQVIEGLHEREQGRINQLKNRLEELNEEKARLISMGEQNKKESRETYFDLTFLSMRALVILLAFLVIMVGWIVKGVLHAKSVSRFKFFGFCFKFFESVGWSFVFSIVGLLPGVPIIILSQFMEIIHANQQGVEGLELIGHTECIAIEGGSDQ
jgi:hypothetical protein